MLSRRCFCASEPSGQLLRRGLRPIAIAYPESHATDLRLEAASDLFVVLEKDSPRRRVCERAHAVPTSLASGIAPRLRSFRISHRRSPWYELATDCAICERDVAPGATARKAPALCGRSARRIAGECFRPAFGIAPSRMRRARWSTLYPLSRAAASSDRASLSSARRAASRSSAQCSSARAEASPPYSRSSLARARHAVSSCASELGMGLEVDRRLLAGVVREIAERRTALLRDGHPRTAGPRRFRRCDPLHCLPGKARVAALRCRRLTRGARRVGVMRSRCGCGPQQRCTCTIERVLMTAPGELLPNCGLPRQRARRLPANAVACCASLRAFAAAAATWACRSHHRRARAVDCPVDGRGALAGASDSSR